MPEAIIDGTGQGNFLVVNSDGSINVSGVSLSVGSLSIDNIYITSGDNISISSMPKTEVYTSGLVIGSIVSMPPISVSAGSISYVPAGSVIVTNLPTYFPGSVYQNTNPWITLGSTQITNSILPISGVVTTDINNPSTIGSYTNQQIIGSVAITTSPVPISGNVLVSGTISLNNVATIGSYTTQGIIGSVNVGNFPTYFPGSVYQNTNPWIITGSVAVTNTITGSIISMPNINVTTGSEQWIKNFNDLGSNVVVTNLYTGSKVYQDNVFGVSGIVEVSNMVAGSIVYMPAVNVSVGSEVYIKAGSVEVYNMVAGSIVYMPAINVSTGSESWIKGGSIQIYNPIGIGSSLITNLPTNYPGSVFQSTNPWITLGSQQITNTLLPVSGIINTQLYAGSESWIRGGSITTYGIGSILVTNVLKTEVYGSGLFIGSIISMPSVSVSVGSESYIPAGSVIVTNMVAGSIVYMPTVNVSVGSESYIKAGSIIITNFGDLGSSRIITNLYAGSETWEKNAYLGSEVWEKNLYAGSKIYQGDIFGVSGIVDISNKVAGSIVNMPSIIGSVAITNQYLGSESWVKEIPKTEVYTSGIVSISGIVGVEFSNDYVNVIQSGNNWAVSGIVTVNINSPSTIGSLATQNIIGSIQVNNFPTYFPGSVFQSTNPWIILGSTQITNSVLPVSGTSNIIGSVAITTSPVPVSGILTVDINNAITVGSYSIQGITGSVAITNIGSVIQATNPWIVSGNVLVSGTVSLNAVATIGSYTLQNITGSVNIISAPIDFTLYYKQLIDYQGGYQPIYIGLALPGTGSNATGWFIRKYLYTNDLNIATLFGSGNTNFDKVWDSRSGTNEVYS